MGPRWICNNQFGTWYTFAPSPAFVSRLQVVGATCGTIHGEFPGLESTTTPPEVSPRALATHRAAVFFGLPRLQNKVRDWLETNGVEMKDDGTGVLSKAAAS